MVYNQKHLKRSMVSNIKTPAGKTFLCVDSERIPEYMEHYRKHNFCFLDVNPEQGYARKEGSIQGRSETAGS